MYIFELIANAFKSKKYHKFEYIDEDSSDLKTDDSVECEHVFLPLDSTNTMFACKYCGLVVPKEKLKDRNIFKQH